MQATNGRHADAFFDPETIAILKGVLDEAWPCLPAGQTNVTRSLLVNASLKLPENQRFEIVGFLALLGRILWFDPRREHSSIPTANSRSRRAQGLSRLAASSRPPEGLGLDWPEHGGILNRIGAGGAHHIIGKFKPLVLGEIHAAGDIAGRTHSEGRQGRGA
jgi:hypothetical protein